MFWTIVERLALLLGTALAGKELVDLFADIKPNSVYSPEEIATLFKMEKADVLGMIHSGKLKALKNNRQYRILGRNVIDALSQIEEADESGDTYEKQFSLESRQN